MLKYTQKNNTVSENLNKKLKKFFFIEIIFVVVSFEVLYYFRLSDKLLFNLFFF